MNPPKGAKRVHWAQVHKAVNWFGVFVNENLLNEDKLKRCDGIWKMNDGIYVHCKDHEDVELWVPVPNIGHALVDREPWNPSK